MDMTLTLAMTPVSLFAWLFAGSGFAGVSYGFRPWHQLLRVIVFILRQLFKNLVKKYHDSHGEDKEVLVTIKKAVDASPELRSKKALIESFISGVNAIDDVMDVWHDYVIEMKEKDLVIIIEEERLKPDETREFMDKSFQDGELKTIGTDIDKIMPPVSRFGGSGRAKRKEALIRRLMMYFEKFRGLV